MSYLLNDLGMIIAAVEGARPDVPPHEVGTNPLTLDECSQRRKDTYEIARSLRGLSEGEQPKNPTHLITLSGDLMTLQRAENGGLHEMIVLGLTSESGVRFRSRAGIYSTTVEMFSQEISDAGRFEYK